MPISSAPRTSARSAPSSGVFAGDPSASEAIYRLAQALREGRAGEEEVRMPAPLAGPSTGDDGARWYRINARPLVLPARRQTMSAWAVADISRERARQESVFQELQHAIDYLDHAPAGFFSAEPDGRIVYINATLAEWLGIDLANFEAGRAHASQTSCAATRSRCCLRCRPRKGAAGPRSSTSTSSSATDRACRCGCITACRAPPTARRARRARSSSTAARARKRRRRCAPPKCASRASSTTRRSPSRRSTRRAGSAAPTPPSSGSSDRARRASRGGSSTSSAPAERDRIEAALATVAAGASVIPPIDASLAANRERSVRFYINPVEDSAGEDEAVIVNALDTTEQRALEQQFAQSQKMEAVGQLAGGVAHDFNNVLTAIIGFSDLLLANHRPSDPSFQDIMNIKQNANRAAGLVRQLLAFSRRQTLRPQVLALGEVLSDLSILLTRLLGENVKLQLVHGRDLWPIKADLNQFEQVVINLAVNARDAMPKGGTMTIRTRNLSSREVAAFGYKPLPEADYVLIEVEDTGTGMTPECRRRSSSRSSRPRRSARAPASASRPSTASSSRPARISSCRASSATARSSASSCRAMCRRPSEKVATAAVEAEPEIADLTGSASVLLVEDEEAVRAFAARALASRGYKVYEAASGVEALEVMEEAGGKIDLVVSDVVMPELDGPSLLRELRKTRPDLKIIFISGYAEDAFKKNLPEGEEFHFLPKPFSLKQLAVAVKETLGR